MVVVGLGEAHGTVRTAMIASGIVLVLVTAFLSGVGVIMTPKWILIVVLPLWVHRVSREGIVSVDAIEVRPFEDFGGWGIKGHARRAGLLFSAGGSQVVRLRTCDSRTYLISCNSAPATQEQLRSMLKLGKDIEQDQRI
jgi:hypothetical protein